MRIGEGRNSQLKTFSKHAANYCTLVYFLLACDDHLRMYPAKVVYVYIYSPVYTIEQERRLKQVIYFYFMYFLPTKCTCRTARLSETDRPWTTKPDKTLPDWWSSDHKVRFSTSMQTIVLTQSWTVKEMIDQLIACHKARLKDLGPQSPTLSDWRSSDHKVRLNTSHIVEQFWLLNYLHATKLG